MPLLDFGFGGLDKILVLVVAAQMAGFDHVCVFGWRLCLQIISVYRQHCSVLLTANHAGDSVPPVKSAESCKYELADCKSCSSNLLFVNAK